MFVDEERDKSIGHGVMSNQFSIQRDDGKIEGFFIGAR